VTASPSRAATSSCSTIRRSASNLDPRTFVGLTNSLVLPGAVYDMFQGNDGALRIFTSAGVFSLPTDAIGNGQSVQGFLSRIPGLDTSRSRNACACAGAGVVLQRDRVVVLGDEGNPINLAPYEGRRHLSSVVAVDDLRLAGELYPTPTGFIVGFRGKRGHFVDVNIGTRALSYYVTGSPGFNVVGTLRSRDGEALVVCSDGVFVPGDRPASKIRTTRTRSSPPRAARSTSPIAPPSDVSTCRSPDPPSPRT
jgi:hypothetical protein